MDEKLPTKDGAEVTVIRSNPEPDKQSFVSFLKTLFSR